MDRLAEKFARASKVCANVTRDLESKMDTLIQREGLILQRGERAVAPHHQLLDEHLKGLDMLERNFALIENAPLDSSSSGHGPGDPPGYKEAV